MCQLAAHGGLERRALLFDQLRRNAAARHGLDLHPERVREVLFGRARRHLRHAARNPPDESAIAGAREGDDVRAHATLRSCSSIQASKTDFRAISLWPILNTGSFCLSERR